MVPPRVPGLVPMTRRARRQRPAPHRDQRVALSPRPINTDRRLCPAGPLRRPLAASLTGSPTRGGRARHRLPSSRHGSAAGTRARPDDPSGKASTPGASPRSARRTFTKDRSTPTVGLARRARCGGRWPPRLRARPPAAGARVIDFHRLAMVPPRVPGLVPMTRRARRQRPAPHRDQRVALSPRPINTDRRLCPAGPLRRPLAASLTGSPTLGGRARHRLPSSRHGSAAGTRARPDDPPGKASTPGASPRSARRTFTKTDQHRPSALPGRPAAAAAGRLASA